MSDTPQSTKNSPSVGHVGPCCPGESTCREMTWNEMDSKAKDEKLKSTVNYLNERIERLERHLNLLMRHKHIETTQEMVVPMENSNPYYHDVYPAIQ